MEKEKEPEAEAENQDNDAEDEEEYFLGNLLDYLMNKFEDPSIEINPTSIGYFQRIMNSLINKNGQIVPYLSIMISYH